MGFWLHVHQSISQYKHTKMCKGCQKSDYTLVTLYNFIWELVGHWSGNYFSLCDDQLRKLFHLAQDIIPHLSFQTTDVIFL